MILGCYKNGLNFTKVYISIFFTSFSFSALGKMRTIMKPFLGLLLFGLGGASAHLYDTFPRYRSPQLPKFTTGLSHSFNVKREAGEKIIYFRMLWIFSYTQPVLALKKKKKIPVVPKALFWFPSNL